MTNEHQNRLLTDIAEEYFASKARVRAPRTRDLMLQTVRRLAEYLGRDPLLSDLNDKTIAAFLRHREAGGLSPASVERECNKLLAFARWAARRGWIELPTIESPKAVLPAPVAWSRQEVKRLFAAAAASTGVMKRIPNNLFFPALLMLAWETGERIGAIRALRWQDIDFENCWVVYRGSTRKGWGAADNQQRISRRCRKLLLALRAVHDHETPFGFCHETNMYFHLKKIHRAAGLPYGRHDMMHRMRRSHATWLHAAGGDATTSLGHSSDYITRKRYLDVRYLRKTFGADAFAGFFSRSIARLRHAIGL